MKILHYKRHFGNIIKTWSLSVRVLHSQASRVQHCCKQGGWLLTPGCKYLLKGNPLSTLTIRSRVYVMLLLIFFLLLSLKVFPCIWKNILITAIKEVKLGTNNTEYACFGYCVSLWSLKKAFHSATKITNLAKSSDKPVELNDNYHMCVYLQKWIR